MRPIVLAVTLVCLAIVRRFSRRGVQLHLLTDAIGNEALVTSGTVGGRRMLFLIDTAYAGAPVLATTYLALPVIRGSMQSAYRHVVDELRNVSDDQRHQALANFLHTSRCRTFTSGCTMRLMSIGAVAETHSDMLLCPALKLFGALDASEGDIFVTNALPTSIHILTMDYLLHRAPSVLLMRERRLKFYVNDPWMRASFKFLPSLLIGGAPSIHMLVGGVMLLIVLDTGAAAALSLSPNAAQRLHNCKKKSHTGHKAIQRGVNGERICSDVIYTDVQFGEQGPSIVDVETFVNTHGIDGAGGYAGLGLLRCVDLWLTFDAIGVRKSGLPSTRSRALSEGSCGGSTVQKCILSSVN